jgi:hypothetical protein
MSTWEEEGNGKNSTLRLRRDFEESSNMDDRPLSTRSGPSQCVLMLRPSKGLAHGFHVVIEQ